MIVLFSLFLTVFLQMEVRRLGYVVWKQSHDYKMRQDSYRILVSEHAKVTRVGHLQEVAANSLTLSEPKSGQIIHMVADQVALKQ
jgi:hypothetical protein